MNHEIYCLVNAIFMGVLLNIILSLLFPPFATNEEKKRPQLQAASLPLKGQFMQMMVHHNKILFMSSLIIALIVGLSVFLGYKLKPCERLMKLFK
tara:strand:- start:629 stop:913 length:285 start_codon:yes stop_codon:yes gene_type:complete